MKNEIKIRFQAASCQGEASFVHALATHLGALDEHWVAFHAEPFEWRNGRRLVRGTQEPWPENVEYQTRIEAMLDSRIVFDSLRLSFLIPDNALAGTVRDAIYQLADRRADGDAFRPIADGMFGDLDEASV